MTFSGKISFPSKVPEFLPVLFNLISRKTFSCIILKALVPLCCVHCASFDILSSFYHVYSKISLQPFKSMGLENHVYE